MGKKALAVVITAVASTKFQTSAERMFAYASVNTYQLCRSSALTIKIWLDCFGSHHRKSEEFLP